MKGALYSKKMLAYLRSVLMERRKRLTHAIQSELSPTAGYRGKASTDLLDAAIESSPHELALQMAAVGANEVQCIDRALKRIEEGTYGVCTECGELIGEARLRALPYAELCVKCQTESEKEEKEKRVEMISAPEYDAFSVDSDSDETPLRIRGRKLG